MAASAFTSSVAESEQDKTILQRVVTNRPRESFKGGSGFTAADNVICAVVTQAL
jgi:hypothetical protein